VVASPGGFRTFLSSLGGALALHVLVAIVAGRSRSTTQEEAPAERLRPSSETEIALVDEGAERPEQGPIAANANVVSRDTRAFVPRGSDAHGDDRADREITEHGDDYTIDPSAPPRAAPEVDLGIAPGAWAKWGDFTKRPVNADHARGPTSLPAPASTSGGLVEALDALDRQAGFGPDGTLLSAARDAATQDVAPFRGAAQFAVTVYQGGAVVVSLAVSNGDAASWTEVGKRMEASLRRKPPRIKADRHGTRWTIEILAEERWPTGAPVRPEMPHVATTLPTPHGVDDAKAELQKRNPAAAPPPGAPAETRPLDAIVDAPGAYVSGRNRFGEYSLGVGQYNQVGVDQPSGSTRTGLVLKGNLDPTNLVGRSTRTLTARVIAETAL
jgi:hypothetical protein